MKFQNVETTRFGNLEMDIKDILSFKEGLFGYSQDVSWIILEPIEENPLPIYWLQSANTPNLAFCIVSPHDTDCDLIRSYCSVTDEEEIFVILNKDEGGNLVGNFQGPIIVNEVTQTGRQVIVSELPLRVPMI